MASPALKPLGHAASFVSTNTKSCSKKLTPAKLRLKEENLWFIENRSLDEYLWKIALSLTPLKKKEGLY